MKKIADNDRGLNGFIFQDTYGEECSITESTYAEQPRIWLGINKVEPKICVLEKGFVPYKIPEDVLLNSRMHINQEQAKMLINILEKFVKEGKL